ncbi:unnamed protein product [Clonostachys rosea f. rosea IK726]|uniref:Thioredoxin domain-containing protein n=2 Tax=Bionectria ochroleuca TaxID=29856 RepID=A0A0B7KIM3_BIOOC|nr:unnamed protein product [Clonostachys rosea f. rosea IK726]
MASASQDSNPQSQPAGGELASFKSIPAKETSPVPTVGDIAPSSPKLRLPDGKLTIIAFLRHCGCPFAEKTFRTLADVSEEHHDIHCIAVSHSSEEATDRWLPQVGGTWSTDVIVDEERDLYAKWGLGLSSTWHALSPSVLWSAYKLGTGEGIWNRTTESGSRWQMSGAFAVNRFGTVVWAHVARSADDIPDFQQALKALSGK